MLLSEAIIIMETHACITLSNVQMLLKSKGSVDKEHKGKLKLN